MKTGTLLLATAAVLPRLAGLDPAAAQEAGTVFRDCPACPEMVVVPPGTFAMGSSDAVPWRFRYERPRHTVTIAAPLAVGVHEVTFAQWDACVKAGGCEGYRPGDEGWGRGSRPVINVRWVDAQSYVRWLSRETGMQYRLLSEAEWEYVARAGSSGARPWGDAEALQCRYANGYDQTGAARIRADEEPAACADGYVETAPAGSLEPNSFGLHDLLGNVWEWTADCWHDSYSGAPTDGSAWQSGDCTIRVLRGGSWNNGPSVLRSANRDGGRIGDRDHDMGLRIARDIH